METVLIPKNGEIENKKCLTYEQVVCIYVLCIIVFVDVGGLLLYFLLKA